MRTSIHLLLFAVAGIAQNVSGPVAGYVADRGGAQLLPVLGIPGAALLGDPLALGAGRSTLALSPSQDYALVVHRTNGTLLLVPTGDPANARTIEGGLTAPDRVAISPNGSAALLLTGSQLQIVTGLPDAPTAGTPSGITALGSVGAVAVSDDGSLALLVSGAGSAATLYSVNSTGTLRWLAALGQDVLVSFANRSHSAAIAGLTTNEVWMLDNAAGDFALRRLAGPEHGISGPAGVAFSGDNLRLFAAHSAGVVLVDLNASAVARVSCPCTPTGLARMSGNSVFRLTEPSSEPMWLLDASGANAQVWFVPPKPATAASKGGNRR